MRINQPLHLICSGFFVAGRPANGVFTVSSHIANLNIPVPRL